MGTKRQWQSGEGSNNSSAKIPQPKFYKIIFSPQCSCLSIPEDFADIYCKNLQSPAWLEVPGCKVWEVEVVHSEGQIWLAKGWQDFRDYYSISCGHFLMFGYSGRSHFNVNIFDLSATEIKYPTTEIEPLDSIEAVPERHKGKAKVSDVVEHSVENLGHRSYTIEEEESRGAVVSPSFKRKNQKRSEGCRENKQQSKIVSDVVEHSVENLGHKSNIFEEEESQWGIVSSSFTRKSGRRSEGCSEHKQQPEKVPDVVEHSVEHLGHKSNITEEEESQGGTEGCGEHKQQSEIVLDVVEHSVDNPGHKSDIIEEEESRGGVVSPSFTRENEKRNEGCEEHKQQPEIVPSTNEADGGEEIAANYQRAKAFQSKNPFVISFMYPSFVSHPFSLSIPVKFARRYFRTYYRNIVLSVPEKGSWSVKCTFGEKNARFNTGWKAFVLDNKLKAGDVCVFEVIGVGPLTINVTIFRAVEEVPGFSDSESEDEASDQCPQHISAAYQRAKAFTSENPFFICAMQPSYVCGNSLNDEASFILTDHTPAGCLGIFSH